LSFLSDRVEIKTFKVNAQALMHLFNLNRMTAFYERAKQMDDIDPLARFRERFVHPEKLIYLDGNSLGKLPLSTKEKMPEVLEQEWGQGLIRSWNEKWLALSKKIAAKIAPIVGARSDEIFVGDTTSLNLFKLAHAALQVQHNKTEILTDDLNFPSDHYVLQGLIANHFPKKRLKILRSKDGISMQSEELLEGLSPNTALLSLSHVCYKSAFQYDLFEINEMASKVGALTLWDLSHSVGAVPVHLADSGADLAVACTYKYLNGGPGSPAFLYVRKELQEELNNPIWSWFGHHSPFAFDPDYQAGEGIERFAVSTPPVLALHALEGGLDLILEAEMDNLQAKSVLQSNYLLQMIQSQLLPLGFEVASPLLTHRRGSHISIRHPKAYQINRAMIEPLHASTPVIIPDFRPPDLIRIGIAPLYNTFMDLYRAVERIREIIDHGEMERAFEPQTVT
jgi:kynureninase